MKMMIAAVALAYTPDRPWRRPSWNCQAGCGDPETGAPATQKPAEPAPAAPPPAAAQAPAVPGRRQDRLHRSAVHRVQLGRRQGGDRQDSGVRQEEDGGARGQAEGARGSPPEAAAGRHGAERNGAQPDGEGDRQDGARAPVRAAGSAVRAADAHHELQNDFQTRLNPIIDQVANEKGLHLVLSIADSGVVWVNTGLNISAEVMKRLDSERPRRSNDGR